MSNVVDYGKPVPDPPRVRLVQGEAVSLGCGTLILIAIIVSIFSGGSKNDVRKLQTEISSMQKQLDTQTSQLKSLQTLIEKTHPQ